MADAASIDQLDDAALAALALDQPQLFAHLFRRYVHDVHRFLRRRTGDDALADDLTAQVFERCWRALPSYEQRRTSMRPWLLRIAANVAASHYRSDARRRRREQLAASGELALSAHADDATGADAHSLGRAAADGPLLAALGELPERHQEVLMLRYLADLSTEEAAATLGVTRGHFAVLQYRASKQLRAAWERHVATAEHGSRR